MPNDDTHEIAPKAAPLRWLWKFNHGFDLVKGLSAVTVLSSLAVGYFQYLNAYQEKVSSQAREDMASATATFTEISRAFSEMQGLAANAVFRFHARRQRDRSDASDKALGTKNAHAISERYEKARIALRENIDVLTRKAEVYIDWASDMLSRCGRQAQRRRRSAVTTGVARLCLRLFRQVQFSGLRKCSCVGRRRVRPRKLPTTNIAPSPKNAALTR